MSLAERRSELEEDLAWRLDELRHLRNQLLGNLDKADWPAVALRSILVMQYAHLEGFARNAFAIYLAEVNERRLRASELHPCLFASAILTEFDALRLGAGEQESVEGRLTRRARKEVEFVLKVRMLDREVVEVDADAAVSMEMNFGSDVLRRTLYRVGIPEVEVSRTYYDSLEFVRRVRNDIAHGSRKEKVEPGLFIAHQKKCEQFMSDLARLITLAIQHEWFRAAPASAN